MQEKGEKADKKIAGRKECDTERQINLPRNII